MTESELRRLVLQSARNARRAYRRADTQGEIFERWLDRQIARKTKIRSDSAAKGQGIYNEYRLRVQAVDAAMTDLLSATVTYG